MNNLIPVSLTNLDDETGRRAGLNTRLTRLFQLVEHREAERGAAESFIGRCFSDMHGARIRHFMPRLISLRSQHGEMIAAFGLRPAAHAPLFLETYLDRPVEEALQARSGHAVRRDEIVEVGNLSALYPGAARWLILAVTSLLHDEGFGWVTFTGTTALRNGFHRLGLRPIELGATTLAHLPEQERADWGRYYDNMPAVMAGDIAQGYQSLLMRSDLCKLLRAGIAPVTAGNAG